MTRDLFAAPIYGFRVFKISTGEPIDSVFNSRTPPEGHERVHHGRPPEHGAVLEIGDSLGAGCLHSPIQTRYAWGPGANEATCLRVTGTIAGAHVNKPGAIPLKCTCGFWAYSFGDHQLAVYSAAVLGVVQAWGQLIIGPRGFRAQYARIVGLCFPDAADPDSESHPGSGCLPEPKESAEAATPPHRPRLSSVGSRVRQVRNRGAEPRARVRSIGDWDEVPDDLRAAVRDRYPAARYFDTVGAMQRAFPPTDLAAVAKGGA